MGRENETDIPNDTFDSDVREEGPNGLWESNHPFTEMENTEKRYGLELL